MEMMLVSISYLAHKTIQVFYMNKIISDLCHNSTSIIIIIHL